MKRPPLPSGAQMWDRSNKVKQNVKKLLKMKPTSRGQNWIALIYYLHYFVSNNLVHVTFGKHITITIKGWDALFSIPSTETIRRRRAEWQNEKNPDGSYKNPELRPSERTIIKRAVRADAIRNYFGSGYKQTDLMEIGVVSE